MMYDQSVITEKLMPAGADGYRLDQTKGEKTDVHRETMKFCEQQEQERVVTLLEAEPTCENLWQAIVLFAGSTFTTAKGLDFSYIVKRNRDGSIGNEIFFSRKEKGITRATVELAFRKALELRVDKQVPAVVSGPKKLRVFGASYLYPVFVKLGVIRTGK